jgi:outer membrane immunogenic protein
MLSRTTSFIAIAAALGFSATAASAADIAPAAYDWSGFYFGANAGVAWNNSELESDYEYIGSPPLPPIYDTLDFDAVSSNLDADDAAFTGGAMIGYNWQSGNLVVGVEADINYLGISDDNEKKALDYFPLPGFPDLNASHDLSFEADWFGTLRGRLGFAADNLLFYGTGGLAYGHMEAKSDLVISTGDIPEYLRYKGSADEVNWGWTIGAGMEYGIDNWSLGIEYLYVDLGDADWDGDVVYADPRIEDALSFNTKGSVDYQFSVFRATAKLRF